MAQHHPEPELLVTFSAGGLPLSQALCVGVHIEYCSHCKTNVERLNHLGAQLIENNAPSMTPSSLRAQVFAKLDSAAIDTKQATQPPISNKTVPRCLRQFIPEDYDSLKWSRVSSSIELASICTDTNGALVKMLRIKAGGKISTHTHTGGEFTAVLEGSFSDESGIYQPGDFLYRDATHTHRPVVTKDARCICLSVSNAPIAFTGFFSRWLNPLIKRSYDQA